MNPRDDGRHHAAWLDDTPIYRETCAAEAERIAAAELDHDLARLLDGRSDR